MNRGILVLIGVAMLGAVLIFPSLPLYAFFRDQQSGVLVGIGPDLAADLILKGMFVSAVVSAVVVGAIAFFIYRRLARR